jgi:hypothetical protein
VAPWSRANRVAHAPAAAVAGSTRDNEEMVEEEAADRRHSRSAVIINGQLLEPGPASGMQAWLQGTGFVTIVDASVG